MYNNNECIVTCHVTFISMNLKQFYPNPTHDIQLCPVTACRLASVTALNVCTECIQFHF